jgi:hypothetical protein
MTTSIDTKMHEISAHVTPPSRPDELIYIRDRLEQAIPGYPTHQCYKAARIIHEILGFPIIGGEYLGLTSEYIPRHHVWNYDPQTKLYVDITLDQFSGKYPKVTFLPNSTPLLKKGFVETIRQRMSRIPELADIIDDLRRELDEK